MFHRRAVHRAPLALSTSCGVCAGGDRAVPARGSEQRNRWAISQFAELGRGDAVRKRIAWRREKGERCHSGWNDERKAETRLTQSECCAGVGRRQRQEGALFVLPEAASLPPVWPGPRPGEGAGG